MVGNNCCFGWISNGLRTYISIDLIPIQPLQDVHIYLISVWMLLVVEAKSGVSWLDFIQFVTFTANDARALSAGPTSEPTSRVKSTRKASLLLKRLIFIWKRVTITKSATRQENELTVGESGQWVGEASLQWTLLEMISFTSTTLLWVVHQESQWVRVIQGLSMVPPVLQLAVLRTNLGMMTQTVHQRLPSFRTLVDCLAKISFR
jgi:hypothetical protein